MTNGSECFVYWKKSVKPRVRLICFPFAGGSALLYKDWVKYLPDEVELLAIELPGRGRRFGERLYEDISVLVRDVVARYALLPELPLAVFGHSMGGLLGFEFVRTVSNTLGHEASHFFASASRAPHLPMTREPTHNLPEGEFLQKLGESDGLPNAIFENKEFREFFVPILRSDVRLYETYSFSEKFVLKCPITVLGGTMDEDILPSDLISWQECTEEDTFLHFIDGGHFFITSHREHVVSIVSRSLLEFTIGPSQQKI